MSGLRFVNILEANDELKEIVRQWRNRDDIRKSMLTQHNISNQEHSQWIKELNSRDDRKFYIVFIGDTPIGSVYLQKINHAERSSEWGFYIGEDGYKGKGLGKCIIFKLLEMFFDEMKFEKLVTKVLSNNAGALNIYEKFKFQELRRLPFSSEEDIVFLEFFRHSWIKTKDWLRDNYVY